MSAASAPSAAGSNGSPAFSYPTTRRGSDVDEYFGTKVADPYRWLEAPDAPETAAWVSAQNAVTRGYLQNSPDRDALVKRLTEAYNFERFSCPWRKGADWVFQFRNSGLQNQSVLYKQRGLDAEPEVLLDPNGLAADGTAALGSYGMTESGSLLAYGVARSGSDWNTISVRRVSDGADLDDKIEWVKFSGVSWTHDEKGFFYSRYPAPKEFQATAEQADPDFKRGTETSSVRDHHVCYHRVGTPQSEDIVVHRVPVSTWNIGAEVTDDGRFVWITLSESCDTKNQVVLLPLNEDKSFSPALLERKVPLVSEFVAEHGYVTNEGNTFFVRTNRDAGRYKLIAMDVARGAGAEGTGKDGAADPDTWRTVIAEHEKDVLQSVSAVAGDKLVAVHSHDVAEKLALYNQAGNLLQDNIPLPDVGSISGLTARKADSEFFYSFTGFLHPGIIQRVQLGGAAAAGGVALSQTVFREIKVAGFDPSGFETTQVFVTVADGTRVPMFVVARRGLSRDGQAPCWLYGYGGFNISLPPSFSVARMLWLEHFGGVFALANIRGGGEMGESWYKAGVKLSKKNCFTDFCSAAEYLIEHKYTSAPKLCINGGSNGGLLVAACVNARPELFGAVVGAVGVLDMLKFDTWTIGHAWTSDYGSARDSEEMFQYLRSYSPVHNVRTDARYPAVLLTTSDHDDRVVPLHSYKFISELQSVAGQHPEQKAPLLIRVEEKAGHGAGLPLAKRIQEQADTLAFMSIALKAKSNFQHAAPAAQAAAAAGAKL